jgi:hypothetical protein
MPHLLPASTCSKAMPGPLFNLSAYLGALFASKFGYFAPLGSAVAWLGLFGPGVALMFAAMPFWKGLRSLQVYKNALPGETQLQKVRRHNLYLLTRQLSRQKQTHISTSEQHSTLY